jgi:hypothetical protein
MYSILEITLNDVCVQYIVYVLKENKHICLIKKSIVYWTTGYED